MECHHNSVSFAKGFPHCLDCGRDFEKGELRKIYKERESKCNHTNLEFGYASNPPKARCLDCGGYFTDAQLKMKKGTKLMNTDEKKLQELLNEEKVEEVKIDKYSIEIKTKDKVFTIASVSQLHVMMKDKESI